VLCCVGSDVVYCPCSGYTGANLKEPVSTSVAPWYNGPSFLQILDKLKSLERDPNQPVRVPIIARYKEMGGLFVLGKVRLGSVSPSLSYSVFVCGVFYLYFFRSHSAVLCAAVFCWCVVQLESGTLYKGQKLLMQPNSVEVEVQGIQIDEVDVNLARTGENLLLKIKGIEEEDVHVGFVLSPVENPAKRTKEFEAQVCLLWCGVL
jgi:peptide chain release factor subunit 3